MAQVCHCSSSVVAGKVYSLSGDGLVLGESDVLTDAAESTWLVREGLRGVDTLTQRQGQGIVVELHLSLSSLAIVDGANTRVLLVEP